MTIKLSKFNTIQMPKYSAAIYQTTQIFSTQSIAAVETTNYQGRTQLFLWHTITSTNDQTKKNKAKISGIRCCNNKKQLSIYNHTYCMNIYIYMYIKVIYMYSPIYYEGNKGASILYNLAK